jgi:NADPH-dependent 2,4-dienoyl-CoA reductase/sulfur reductase-like enzyme
MRLGMRAVTPNTEWLEGSGLTLDNGIVCNGSGEAAPDVYAAGDVARVANRWHGGLVFLVLLIDLIDDVGGVLECLVEFVQLLAAVGVVIGLEFFDNGRSVVYVRGEFAESVGRHE